MDLQPIALFKPCPNKHSFFGLSAHLAVKALPLLALTNVVDRQRKGAGAGAALILADGGVATKDFLRQGGSV